MARLVHGISSTLVRRRRRSDIPTVKKSFTLHTDVVEAVDAAVDAGEAANMSAFVETAIQEKLRRSKRERLYGAYQEAAQDTAFMADMYAVSAQFEATSADGLSDD
jgi:Arc/MetJ-type ribon-helix-helix transcriptional regulator